MPTATIPEGTVTLLFSDMEGSTRLLSRLGDQYLDALDAQRHILRETWTAFGGTELGTEGDSFYVVFPVAERAVGAVAAGQRRLAEFSWPAGERVRVRMGMHTGSPIPHDGAYVGMDVHRAARIAAAAHGGQVTMSAATAALVGSALPPGSALRDLGTHRLKDLPRPEHIYQLDVEGLNHDFPPLRSLGASSTLPLADAPLLGRDQGLESLRALVATGERLVTLTGAGGAGKTTLAAELARTLVPDFPDGAYFVPLASVTEETGMWQPSRQPSRFPRTAMVPRRSASSWPTDGPSSCWTTSSSWATPTWSRPACSPPRPGPVSSPRRGDRCMWSGSTSSRCPRCHFRQTSASVPSTSRPPYGSSSATRAGSGPTSC